MNLQHILVLVTASAVAGAVNSVAGGGTLLTFPALIWTGQVSLIANATSAAALLPGYISSLFGYRRELTVAAPVLGTLALSSVLGGIVGAILLLHTPAKVFDRIVPGLILAATLLFVVQEPVSRWVRARAAQSEEGETPKTLSLPLIGAGQFFIAIYGGYFGAGTGILMLAAFGFMGFTNIHQMNGLKNLNALILNGIAAAIFIEQRIVDWHIALIMACGSVVGGYAGAGTAKHIGQKNVRRSVIFIGFALTIYMLWRQLAA